MEFKFSVYGLVIFLLPMLINIVYFLLPPKNIEEEASNQNKILESIEQISKIAYAVVICTDISSCVSSYVFYFCIYMDE